jgi:HAD superfamily hydrolase (TIGR01509 family)
MELKHILDNKKLHVFDMDGTLVNLEELNRSSYASTINEFFNIELDNIDYQRYFSGTKTAKAFNSYLKNKEEANYSVNELIENFRTIKENSLRNYFNECVSLISKAREYLELLDNKGKSIILATSTIKTFTEIILKKAGLINYFDVIITAEDVSKGKPDPEIYNLSVSKFDFSKELSVVYEDSKNGINAAISAEILCVGVHSEGLNDMAIKNADYVINDYSELV